MNTPKSKKIKCPVYGFINLPASLKLFVDHPLFQRLERIKQLGLCFKVYPSASHSRKEHSLGVMHLAGVVVDRLRELDNVNISDREKELIQLGGLYHDIGHLAFSHMFDVFIHEIDTSGQDEFFHIKKHENRSIYLLNKVNDELNLLTEQELAFVSNVILGIAPDNTRKYLYQIINNSVCGIDVDKMDYLYRDAYHSGMPTFQSVYIISCMVIDQDLNIAFKHKAHTDILNMFNTRHTMFENVYMHHTVQKIDKMYKCAMKRLGPEIFRFGLMTVDGSIDVLLRLNSETSKMMDLIDYRQFDHVCDRCTMFPLDNRIKESGNIGQVIFV